MKVTDEIKAVVFNSVDRGESLMADRFLREPGKTTRLAVVEKLRTK
jgi:hypothetical protein